MNLFHAPEELDNMILDMFPGHVGKWRTRDLLVQPDAYLEYRELVYALLQVHDSFVGMLPTLSKRGYAKQLLPDLVKAMAVRVPYADPLVIGMDYKSSEKSWGDC